MIPAGKKCCDPEVGRRAVKDGNEAVVLPDMGDVIKKSLFKHQTPMHSPMSSKEKCTSNIKARQMSSAKQ